MLTLLLARWIAKTNQDTLLTQNKSSMTKFNVFTQIETQNTYCTTCKRINSSRVQAVLKNIVMFSVFRKKIYTLLLVSSGTYELWFLLSCHNEWWHLIYISSNVNGYSMRPLCFLDKTLSASRYIPGTARVPYASFRACWHYFIIIGYKNACAFQRMSLHLHTYIAAWA